jgi:hypothetical protein
MRLRRALSILFADLPFHMTSGGASAGAAGQMVTFANRLEATDRNPPHDVLASIATHLLDDAAQRQRPKPRISTGISMSDTVTLVIGHSLGKMEAVRRLKEGFARADGHLGAMVAMDQATWQGDTVRFRMRALGQTAAGTIEVLEDALRIEVSLPLLLAKAAKVLLPILRKEAALLLDKKK